MLNTVELKVASMSSVMTLIFSLNYKTVKCHSKNIKRNYSFISNMEAEDSFGNTDMQINYLSKILC